MKSYTCHYVMQRLTACVLLVLVPWFLWNLLCVKELGYYAVLKNFANPYSATLLFFILVGGFDEELFREGSGEDWDLDKKIKEIAYG